MLLIKWLPPALAHDETNARLYVGLVEDFEATYERNAP